MPRFPVGTPYVGPSMCYDDQIEPEQLLRRLAYGRAAPLLGRYGRLDAPFFGKLFDALANQHAVLVKSSPHRRTCEHVVTKLRAELPAALYAVGVLEAPERDEWLVMVYNRVPADAKVPPRRTDGGMGLVSAREAARVLGLTLDYTRELIKAAPIEHKRIGGRREIHVRQCDLVVLANRPHQRRRRKKRRLL